jgi:hypothetical protein
MAETLTGTVSISRYNNSDLVAIRVRDAASGALVVEAEMSVLAFANALFARAERPCEFTFNRSGVVGMAAENKTEIIGIPGYPNTRNAKCIRALVKAFEVDGWSCRESDLTNRHCVGRDDSGGMTLKVVFFRHVHPTTGEPFRPMK